MPVDKIDESIQVPVVPLPNLGGRKWLPVIGCVSRDPAGKGISGNRGRSISPLSLRICVIGPVAVVMTLLIIGKWIQCLSERSIHITYCPDIAVADLRVCRQLLHHMCLKLGNFVTHCLTKDKVWISITSCRAGRSSYSILVYIVGTGEVHYPTRRILDGR